MNFWTTPRNSIPARKMWIFLLCAFALWAALYAVYIALTIRADRLHVEHVINELRHAAAEPYLKSA